MYHQKKGNPSNTFTHISLRGKDRVVWIDEVGNVTSILVKPSMWRLDVWLKTTFRNFWNVWHFVEMIFLEEERSPQASSFLQASESAESWKHKKRKLKKSSIVPTSSCCWWTCCSRIIHYCGGCTQSRWYCTFQAEKLFNSINIASLYSHQHRCGWTKMNWFQCHSRRSPHHRPNKSDLGYRCIVDIA